MDDIKKHHLMPVSQDARIPMINFVRKTVNNRTGRPVRLLVCSQIHDAAGL